MGASTEKINYKALFAKLQSRVEKEETFVQAKRESEERLKRAEQAKAKISVISTIVRCNTYAVKSFFELNGRCIEGQVEELPRLLWALSPCIR